MGFRAAFFNNDNILCFNIMEILIEVWVEEFKRPV